MSDTPHMDDDASDSAAAASPSPSLIASTPAATGAASAAAASGSAAKGGAKGKGAKRKMADDAPTEVDPQFEGQRFKLGELIYANYAKGKQWYEAKVLKVEKRGGVIYFYLHYQGWTDKYNDWRPYHNDNELHKHDEEGKKLMDEARAKMKEANKKSKTGGAAAAAAAADESSGKSGKKKRVSADDDTVSDEVTVGGASAEVKLKTSGHLKKQQRKSDDGAAPAAAAAAAPPASYVFPPGPSAAQAGVNVGLLVSPLSVSGVPYEKWTHAQRDAIFAELAARPYFHIDAHSGTAQTKAYTHVWEQLSRWNDVDPRPSVHPYLASPRAITLANPKSLDFQLVRTTLLPGLLKALSNNQGQVTLPLRLFEVGDIGFADASTDVGARNERRLGALYCDVRSGFEVVQGLLDRVMAINGVYFAPRVAEYRAQRAKQEAKREAARRAQEAADKKKSAAAAKAAKDKAAPTAKGGKSPAAVAAEEKAAAAAAADDSASSSSSAAPSASASAAAAAAADDDEWKVVDTFSLRPSVHPSYFPGRRADIVLHRLAQRDEVTVGQFGILHPDVCAQFGIPYVCSAMEINLEYFM